jgi:hypothetical protein
LALTALFGGVRGGCWPRGPAWAPLDDPAAAPLNDRPDDPPGGLGGRGRNGLRIARNSERIKLADAAALHYTGSLIKQPPMLDPRARRAYNLHGFESCEVSISIADN